MLRQAHLAMGKRRESWKGLLELAGGRGVARPLPIQSGIAGGKMYMNEQEFQTKLAELMGEISTLPPSERQKLEKLADETRARHERLRQTVSSLQESLDYLRLSIKYLVFDLEATRRENGYLRKMLEETTGGAD
jgi:hypothetical protein